MDPASVQYLITASIAVLVPLASTAASWGGLRAAARNHKEAGEKLSATVTDGFRDIRAEMERMESRMGDKVATVSSEMKSIDERVRVLQAETAVLRDRQQRQEQGRL